ncbi:MAG: hypothetical protein HGJ98_00020, partial [Desulfosporosinus sp.]|nr:hypothetical protein [Desulfosporosinus sp.]
MTLDFKVLQKVKGNPSAEVAPGRRLKSVPDQDYVYDLPKELIYKVQQEFPIDHLIDSTEKTNEGFLAEKGRTFMN